MLAFLALATTPMNATSLYDFKMQTIEGKEQALSAFKGKTTLVVNVASKCGLTKQYTALQKLYETYKDKGFVILGFPANEFGNQEPGTNTEIKEFCSKEYGVSFPMFSKIVVKGEGIHPLYKWLINASGEEKEIAWNFTKFLVNKDGVVVNRFEPRVTPDDPALIKALEAQLATK